MEENFRNSSNMKDTVVIDPNVVIGTAILNYQDIRYDIAVAKSRSDDALAASVMEKGKEKDYSNDIDNYNQTPLFSDDTLSDDDPSDDEEILKLLRQPNLPEYMMKDFEIDVEDL